MKVTLEWREAPPEKPDLYLVSNGDGVWIGIWIRNRWIAVEGGEVEEEDFKITHYTNLPGPPKEPS